MNRSPGNQGAMQARNAALKAAGDIALKEYDALAGYGFETRDILAALGKSSDALRLTAERRGRLDIAAAMRAFDSQDRERLAVALSKASAQYGVERGPRKNPARAA